MEMELRRMTMLTIEGSAHGDSGVVLLSAARSWDGEGLPRSRGTKYKYREEMLCCNSVCHTSHTHDLFQVERCGRIATIQYGEFEVTIKGKEGLDDSFGAEVTYKCRLNK